MHKVRIHHATVISVLALVVALTSAGAWAGTVLVGSKQIRNGSIRSADLHKSAVRSSDIGPSAVTSSDVKDDAVQGPEIGEGAVQTSDIGEGQVQPQDVTAPAPKQLHEVDVAEAEVGAEFTLVDNVGTYSKEDSTSVLEVDWTGTAEAPTTSCTFQLRVDGLPSPDGGGLIFVQLGDITSVSAAALFPGLASGEHMIEVWAQSKPAPGSTDPCIVGPEEAGIPQTFVISERIV